VPKPALRSGLKAQVHAVLAKQGVAVPMTDLFGKAGLDLLDQAPLGPVYRLRVTSLLDLIDAYDHHADKLGPGNRRSPGRRPRLQSDPSHPRRRPGPGRSAGRRDRRRSPVPRAAAAVLLGRADRRSIASPTSSCAAAIITKQGSRLVRWAAVEALPYGTKLRADRQRITERRGNKIAKVAAARNLLTLVYYGLRDGRIRCLPRLAAGQEIA